MARAALLVVALALPLLGCSGGDGCDERSCADGCCGADGVCRTNAPTSCGLRGASCVDCTRSRLACVEGTCEPYTQGCYPNGTVCSGDGECCTNLCSKGRCTDTPCKTVGLSCGTTTECCTDLCHEGACIRPRGLGEPCDLTAKCESSLVCRNGLCGAPCVLQNQECAPGVDQCCGASVCPQLGRCPEVCRQANQPCNDLACCSGLQCLSGTCQP